MPVEVKDRNLRALLVTAVSRNLIAQLDVEAIPEPATLRPPRRIIMVAGNNHEIPLSAWMTLRFRINTRSASHEFGVVNYLAIDMVHGAVFRNADGCQIIYRASWPDAGGITEVYSNPCVRNKEMLKAEHDPQLKGTPRRTAAKRSDLSWVVVATHTPDEQERRREKLRKVLPEWKIDLISVSE